MGPYPRTLTANELSPALVSLVRDLATRMLGGTAPAHAVLRAQLDAAKIAFVELTGVGLFAHFEHPPLTQRIVPARVIGGEVPLEVYGLDAGAGSLIAVSNGLLDFVEIYTFGNDAWPDNPEVLSFGEPTRLPLPASAT